MNPTQNHAAQGLAALKRAARDAWTRAAMHGLDVPIWRDGKVEYVDPAELLAADDETQTRQPNTTDS